MFKNEHAMDKKTYLKLSQILKSYDVTKLKRMGLKGGYFSMAIKTIDGEDTLLAYEETICQCIEKLYDEAFKNNEHTIKLPKSMMGKELKIVYE